MKTKTLWLIPLALGAALGAGPARADMGELVPLTDTRNVFVPVGFDDNDETTVVLDGYLPDPCHRLRQPDVQIDAQKKTVTITPFGERFQGYCPDFIVPYHQIVSLGKLRASDYTVRVLGTDLQQPLAVTVAKNPGPDDYLYAPIDRAEVLKTGHGKMQARLHGRFTDTCLVIEEVKVKNSGKTIEVLPIMKLLARPPHGLPCRPIERPFTAKVDLPQLAAGRYLLHVRSLNGQAVNEIFSTVW